MGKEIEIKLRADSQAQLDTVRCDGALAKLAEGKPMRYEMHTTYYDTTDGGISARRWTFRRRQENGLCVTCLKTPAVCEGRSMKTRCEWETTEAELSKAVDALIADGAPSELTEVMSQSLVEACSAAFVRQAQLLRLSDGSLCELACDAGELSGGTRRRRFFEIELELKEGSPEQLLVLADRLKQQYGLQEERKSKFARANALREQ